MTQAEEDTLAPIVARAKAGEDAAFTELSHRYRERLVRYVESHTSARGLARTSSEDIVQEALMVIATKLPELEYRGVQAFESWILQICEGKIRDWIRHLKAAKRGIGRELVDADGEEGASSRLDQRAGAQETPSRIVYRSEKARTVGQLLDRLSERHARVLRLRHLQGLSFVEIGAELGITEDAAKALYGRAAVRFRALAGNTEDLNSFTQFDANGGKARPAE